jgi:aspartyl/asparaginyl beta-hydroxylase (cupin superfamily)
LLTFGYNLDAQLHRGLGLIEVCLKAVARNFAFARASTGEGNRLGTAPTGDRRIEELMDFASLAMERGQAHEAERLFQQAQAEAPRHPRVAGENARRLLAAGNAAAAVALLQQALADAPSDPALWLGLGRALRALDRADDEMAAIEKALELEPRNLLALLQKASLQEARGDARSAAATYRMALRLIPPGTEPPPAMRPVLLHARKAVEANDRALESFLDDRLRALRGQYDAKALRRIDRSLGVLLQKERIYPQQPSFMHFPQLPAIEFYEREQFPWLESIEAATDDIRAELIDVLADGSSTLEPYVALRKGVPLNQWAELNNSRRWGVYFLWRESVPIAEHIARCPRTVEALGAWPRWDVPGYGPTAVFSIVDAKTRIPAHTGVHNTRLTLHLPLIIPPGCRFRVGAEVREWVPGETIIFDDSIEHEVWNESEVARAVLIFDIWNPYLTAAERSLVSAIVTGVGEYYGKGRDKGRVVA